MPPAIDALMITELAWKGGLPADNIIRHPKYTLVIGPGCGLAILNRQWRKQFDTGQNSDKAKCFLVIKERLLSLRLPHVTLVVGYAPSDGTAELHEQFNIMLS